MELSWSSIVLEIINFLVLIWILKYFFYAPIRKTILERKNAVELKLQNASKLNEEAQCLQLKYENRLADWQLEKEQQQKEVAAQLEQWRLQESANIEKKFAAEKQALLAREQQKINEMIANNANDAMLIAGKFTEKFLTSFADAELERKIISKTINEMSNIPDEKLQQLLKVTEQDSILVQSAYPIDNQQQQQLDAAFAKLVGKQLSIKYTENPQLVAGLFIQIGSLVLQANLRDELKFFTEIKNANI